MARAVPSDSRAVFSDDATPWPAPYLDVVQRIPLILHSTGKDPEILNQPIYLIRCPLSNASHWKAVENRCDVCAKAIGVGLLSFRAVSALGIRCVIVGVGQCAFNGE